MWLWRELKLIIFKTFRTLHGIDHNIPLLNINRNIVFSILKHIKKSFLIFLKLIYFAQFT